VSLVSKALKTEGERALDPVTFAVVRSGLTSAAVDIHWVFKRTCTLPILYEGNDYGAAVYDSRLNAFSESPAAPLFSGALDDCIHRMVAEIGVESLRPGDVLFTSDPGLHGCHAPDAPFAEPIFYEDTLVGYAALRCHVGDLAAINFYPTASTSSYQEGLMVPPIKVYREGILNDDLMRIVRANSRMPVETAGNFMASAAALHAGRDRVLKVIDQYGLDTYLAAVDGMLDHGESIARQRIDGIPDGTYQIEDSISDDGVNIGQPIQLACRVTIDGSRMTVDTTGSAGQVEGPYNCPFGSTLAAARFSLTKLIGADAASPGQHRMLDVIAPRGSVYNPIIPPAASWNSYLPQVRLCAMIANAIAPALPTLVPAPHPADYPLILAMLEDPETRKPSFFAMDTGTGLGAKKGADGASALVNEIGAGVEITPAEVLEVRHPVLRHRLELVTDSGGPGEFRGGLGVAVEYEFLGDGVGMCTSDGIRTWGLAGGLAAPGSDEIIMYPGTDRELRLGKASELPLSAGDREISVTAGGGGYGYPWRRDLNKVRWDVRNGYVSLQAAESIYGVVFTLDGEIDREATARLRRNLEAAATGCDPPES
jgi:N-methylhydantoinase B